MNILKIFKNLKTDRAKSLKKMLKELFLAKLQPPAAFLKNEYIRRSFTGFYLFKKDLFKEHL